MTRLFNCTRNLFFYNKNDDSTQILCVLIRIFKNKEFKMFERQIEILNYF